MKILSQIALATLLTATLATRAVAQDDIRHATTLWTGTYFGNSATVEMDFDMDITAFNTGLGGNTGGHLESNLPGYLTNLSVTVTGASVGNGTFAASDYYYFVIDTYGPLDYSQDLATLGNLADFHLYDHTYLEPAAPNWFFDADGRNVMITDAGNNDGDHVLLTSFVLTPVPEPATGSLLAAGVMGLAGLAWQRRRAAARSARA